MTAAPAARAVLVTRPGGSRDPLVARLAGSGVRVHAVPTVAIGDVSPGGDLDAAAGDLSGYDWVVMTSATAVAALVAALGRVERHPTTVERRPAPVESPGRPGVAAGAMDPAPAESTERPGVVAGEMASAPPGMASAPEGTFSVPWAMVSAPEGPRFAAVGPATARALREAGIAVTVEAADATGAGLGHALRAAGDLAGRRLLLPRASAAGPELPAVLRAAGAVVREVVAYETVEGPAASLPALAAALADPLLGAVVVASGSAVRGLLAIAAIAGADAADPGAADPAAADRAAADSSPLEAVLRALPFVSIGPSTSEEVRRLGLDLAAEAAAPTVDALADAVLFVLERRGATRSRAGERREATHPRPSSGDGPSIDAQPTEVHR